MTFSPEQLNFFKFSTLVLDEFPVALRQVFVYMWDTQVATRPKVPKWNDSVTVLNMLLAKEGGGKKVPMLNKSYKEWDCTALFKATLFAQTFSMPDGSGGFGTLDKLYVRPRGLSAGTFHHSVVSPTGNQAETYALALDQLRLLRNTLCHQLSTQKIDKAIFDHYIVLAKDAFTALGQNTNRIGEIGKLAEEDFPTTRLRQVEDELKREKNAAIEFKQIDDHLSKIESQVTDVMTQIEDFGSDVKDVKTDVTDVKTQVEDFGSDVKELKADVVALKEAMQARSFKGLLDPNSCIPDKVPHFFGRQEECQAILDHLTDGNTRLVDVWGPPGFGKTSVAINVAHQLREMKIPVYFASLRGMESKDELVSKLLSIFADAEQVLHMSPSHWLIQCLQQVQNPFVLILDNVDDLLESGDAKLKEHVLRFIEEILAQCKHIKLLFTTRESLDYLSHKLPIHLERVSVLDEVYSATLVKTLLPNVSDGDCCSIVKECGQVPLAMRLMCSTMREENISVNELLEELKISPLVEVLDNSSFPDDARLKTIINTSFQRLTKQEKDAFVTLAVFPGYFGVEEATAVLHVDTKRTAKKILHSLKRKSLVDCSNNFGSFTVHSLLRSFIDEKRMSDQENEAVFHAAQLRFYDYYISSFGQANEQFLTGHSFDALSTFLYQRKSILLSLGNGTKKDELYPKAVEVLSKAELFLHAVLLAEELLFNTFYDTAAEEARKRQKFLDERKLMASKSFGHWGWFSLGHQTWDNSLQAGCSYKDCPAKLLCYHGVHQLLRGKLQMGIWSLKSSVDRLSNSCDEKVLKVLAHQVLADNHQRPEKDEMAVPHFQDLCSSESQPSLGNNRPTEDDGIFQFVTGRLLSLVNGDALETYNYLDPLHKVVEAALVKGADIIKPMFSWFKQIRHELPNSYENFLKELELDPNFVRRAVVQRGRGLDIFLVLKEFSQAFFEFLPLIHLLENGLDTLQNFNATRQLIESMLLCLECINSPIFGRCGRQDVFEEHPFKIVGRILISSDKVPGVNLEDLARSFDQLGTCHFLLKEYSEALEFHQHAVRVRDETIGEHVDTAASLTSIGCVYFKMKNDNEPDKSCQSAMKLKKQLERKRCTETNNKKALEANQQALKLRKTHLGEHPLIAESYNNIGCVYYKMGDYQSARESFQNAVELNEKLADKHEDTASSCQNLAATYCAMGSYAEALEPCQQAVTLRWDFLGDHVLTAASLDTVVCIHFKMGDNKSAFKVFRDASKMRSRLRGDYEGTDDEDTVLRYQRFSEVVKCGLRDLHRAKKSLQTTSSVMKEISGDHPDISDWLRKNFEG